MFFHKIIFISVILGMSGYSVAAETEQNSLGNHSNNFSNINGNISINYNSNKSIAKTEEDVKDIIRKTNNKPAKEIKTIKWIELNESKNARLLFAAYLLDPYESRSEEAKAFSDLFVIENNNVTRLYHEEAYGSPGLQDIEYGVYNGKTYFLIYNIDGSAAFLNGNVYNLDSFNQLNKAYTLDNIQGASVTSINNNIVIIRTGISQILSYGKNGFFLEKKDREISYPDLGKSKHILKILDCDDRRFELDNTIIATSYIKFMEEKVIKKIPRGDDILIIGAQNIYKLLFTIGGNEGRFVSSDGVETVLTATQKGIVSIDINCHAGIDGISSKLMFEIN